MAKSDERGETDQREQGRKRGDRREEREQRRKRGERRKKWENLIEKIK